MNGGQQLRRLGCDRLNVVLGLHAWRYAALLYVQDCAHLAEHLQRQLADVQRQQRDLNKPDVKKAAQTDVCGMMQELKCNAPEFGDMAWAVQRLLSTDRLRRHAGCRPATLSRYTQPSTLCELV